MPNFPDIAVIDYGMGNIHSVATALHKVAPDLKIELTHDGDRIRRAHHVVFPGVGAIKHCIKQIKAAQLDQVIAEVIQTKPLLAVCVGMQALMTKSDENNGIDCLDIFAGEVKKFNSQQQQEEVLKVPHMGWNQLQYKIKHPLWRGIPNNSWFYFVHSYYVVLKNNDQVAATVNYGHEFTAAVYKDNLFAVQFHPEKSIDCGLQLYKNFVEWDGSS